MSRLVSWLTEQAYRRAAIVIIAVVLLLLYGTYTLTTVRQELIPDIEFPLREALIEGAQTRVRPILVTAFAAMLALVPLSLSLTESLLIASDLGRVVIGGLFSSTLLTLLVIPVVYSLADGMHARVARRFVRLTPATVPATSGPSLHEMNEPGDRS